MRLLLLRLLVAVVLVLGFGQWYANAQGRGGRGTCLAIVNTLNVPIAVHVDSRNGSGMNMAMTGMQMDAIGFEFESWIVDPNTGVGTLRQPTWLLTTTHGNPTDHSYVASMNGDFRISAGPYDVSNNPHFSNKVTNYDVSKIEWAFHPELTEGGVCKGTEIATIR